ncbi:MAG: hypothetical protein ACLSHL_09925 [Alistipes communis]
MVRENDPSGLQPPSVMIWAYMNETLLRPPYTDEARTKEYYKAIEHAARTLR